MGLHCNLFPPHQRAQAVLQAVSAVQDGSSPSSDPGVLDLAPPPSPVLRIIIDNMFYPVTLDVLQQVDADLQQPEATAAGRVTFSHSGLPTDLQ